MWSEGWGAARARGGSGARGTRWPRLLVGLALALALGIASSSHARESEAEPESEAPALSELERGIEALGAGSRSEVRDAVLALGRLGDPAALPALRALADRKLRFDPDGRAYIEGPGRSEVSITRGAGEPPPAGVELRTAGINNLLRRALTPVIARLELESGSVEVRRAAAAELADGPLAESEPALVRLLELESDSEVREQLESALAQLQLDASDSAVRAAAVRQIGASGNVRMRSRLEDMLEVDAQGAYAEPDPEVRAAAKAVLAQFELEAFFRASAQHLLYGLSLGSVLLLAAMGLAITFGLMRVINMAHGEMLMLGAYTTFSVQTLFQGYLPGAIDAYLLVAIPAAFLVTAGVGMLLERLVIRHLYGRPLETLLTTWGISLVLIQTVRLVFGAQNVAVANPSWLAGGVEVMTGVVFPWTRLGTVVFAAAVVSAVWLILNRTRLGLEVRAVTQNRAMAASMGISTERVDVWTFGLGSGIAGLGGVALSQLGNVGPELGQFYIVDSFMVVVLGGVGKIAGAISGALGLGIINKFLEPVWGAVLGKIAVLIVVILVIQRRPEGIFALRGRAAEV